jgi:hypothetical protein
MDNYVTFSRRRILICDVVDIHEIGCSSRWILEDERKTSEPGSYIDIAHTANSIMEESNTYTQSIYKM